MTVHIGQTTNAQTKVLKERTYHTALLDNKA
jgi:hypothetical protein